MNAILQCCIVALSFGLWAGVYRAAFLSQPQKGGMPGVAFLVEDPLRWPANKQVSLFSPRTLCRASTGMRAYLIARGTSFGWHRIYRSTCQGCCFRPVFGIEL